MRLPIFDSLERTSRDPQAHSEATFHFFNRVGGRFWDHSRDLIQMWADHIAHENDYLDLRNRLRSDDDGQFRSAYLELYLHEWLACAGYRTTIHPPVPGRSRRPDFLAESASGSFYLEATVPDTSTSKKAGAARLARVLDALDGIGDSRFFLELCEVRQAVATPKTSRLASEVKAWLKDLDPDSPANTPVSPPFMTASDGWEVTVRALPIPRGRRGTPVRRSIGIYAHMPGGVVDDAAIVVKALRSKASSYGDLDLPYVIAVGLNVFDIDGSDIANALYGHAALSIPRRGATEARSIRLRDGFFGSAPTWNHHKVAAVLVVNQLQPARVLQADASLWQHPAADQPLSDGLNLPGRTVSLRGQELVTRPSTESAGTVFGLPEGWPPGAPWP